MIKASNVSLKHWALAFWALVLLAVPSNASNTQATGPMETLKGPFDHIISILNDPALAAPDKKSTQRDLIWETARPVFNFDAISRLAVGQPWKSFTPDERTRFIKVFSEFLGSTYIDKLQSEYHNEQIFFDKELVKGSKALVRTHLLRNNAQIPIDYRMHQTGGEWKIYDILVENGVSLVKNYRVQFTSILQDQTPAQLIERLENKLDQEKASATNQK